MDGLRKSFDLDYTKNFKKWSTNLTGLKIKRKSNYKIISILSSESKIDKNREILM